MSDLKIYIKNTEERVASYKKMLEGLFRDPAWKHIGMKSESMVWYKQHLRDSLNEQQTSLKELREERSCEISGMHYISPAVIEMQKEEKRKKRVEELVASLENFGYKVEITKT